MKKTIALTLILLLVFSNVLPNASSLAWADENTDEDDDMTPVVIIEETMEAEPQPEVVVVAEPEEPAVDAEELAEEEAEASEDVLVEAEPADEEIREIVEVEPAESTVDNELEIESDLSEALEVNEQEGQEDQSEELETSLEETDKADNGLFADAQPGDESFYTGENSLILDVTFAVDDSSINRHTRPGQIWVGPDNQIYFSIRSTHPLDYMTLTDPDDNTITVDAALDNAWLFGPQQSIYINNVGYSPNVDPPLQGNTKDSHWTVFRLPIDALNLTPGLDKDLAITVISLMGGGHDLENVALMIHVPKVTAVVNKTWVGADGEPVEVVLQRRLLMSDQWEEVTRVSLSPDAPSHTWTNLPYTDLAGRIYVYRVVEPDPGLGYTVEIEPKHDDDYLAYTFNIVNTYTPPALASIQVQKILQGRDWLASDEFSFSLTDKASGVVLGSLSVTDDLPKAFTELEFYETGVYEYLVSELAGDIPGVEYDTEAKLVTVTVEKNRLGELVATVDPDVVQFTNRYSAKPVAVSIQVEKILEGREWIAGDEFSFKLTGYIGETLIERTITVTDDQMQEIANLTFTEPGYYEFKVYELPGSIGGIEYHDTERTVKVRVTDDHSGQLQATVDPWLVQFVNKYSAAPTSAVIQVQKLLAGRPWRADDQFEFRLEGDSLDEPLFISVRDGKVYGFEALSFSEAGIYDFTLTEIAGDIPGISYDTTPQAIKVEVVDDLKGALKATVDPEIVKVTNQYESPLIDIEVTKDWVNGEFNLPEKITIVLKQNGITIDQVELTPDYAGNVHVFKDLPELDELGDPYVYTVHELELEHFESEIDGYKITNSYIIPKTEVSVEKRWQDGENVRPEQVEVVLLRDGEIYKEEVLSAENDWKFTWTDLDETDLSGKRYEYTVEEVGMEEGEVVFDGHRFQVIQKDHIITNRYIIPKIDIVAHKVWVDGPEIKPEVKLQLLRMIKGGPVEMIDGIEAQTPDANGMVIWNDLDQTDSQGNEYIYLVREVEVPKLYVVTYSKNENGGFIVTNTFIGKPKLELIKQADKETFEKVGEVIKYTFVIKNTGDTKLINIELDDPMLGPIKLPRTELKPGESMTVSADYMVTEADVARGYITNVAKVKAESPDTPGRDPQSSDKVVVAHKPVKPVISLPQTGMGNNVALIILGVALLFLALGLFFRRRNPNG